MAILKNREVLRLTAALLAFFLVFLGLAAAAARTSMDRFQQILAEQAAAVVGAALTAAPEAEEAVVAQLQAADPAAAEQGRTLLARYGLDTAQAFGLTERIERQSRLQTALHLGLTAALFGALSFVFIRFVRKQYRIIGELRNYAHRIAEGEYTLDLRDNNEGDVSQLKNEIYKITSMLREQKEQLQRDKVALADFLADISHQLKTPMTSLFMLTDLLGSHPDEQVRRTFLQRIQAQLERMEWLVSSLLKLSKLDAGTAMLKREPFPLRLAVDRALETLSVPLQQKHQQVTVAGDEQAELTGDLQWTAEALINLLKNCIEHTPEHGSIRIALSDNPLYTRILIEDNGAGIDPEDLPHIFTRFYKGKNAGDDSVGIGLAMAHAIVKQQGGDIAAESKPGKGTRFTITFYKQVI